MIKNIYSILFILLIPSFANSSDGDVAKYNSISTLFGFKLSGSKISEVFEKFGFEDPKLHGEKHDLAEGCIKNTDASFGVVLITGNIHDYETLYGYRLTDNPKSECLESQLLSFPEGYRIRLGSEVNDVIKVLGKPKMVSAEAVTWELNLKTLWDEPIIRNWNGKLGGEKYKKVVISRGEYHTVLIRAVFRINSLASFEVVDYSETDSYIENINELTKH